MNKNTIQLKSKLTSIHPLVTGNFSLIFKTQELTSEDKMSILAYHQKEGTLLFQEEESNKNITAIDETEQTQLQRIKAQLKSKYDKDNIKQPFQDWYIEQLSIIIKLIREDKLL